MRISLVYYHLKPLLESHLVVERNRRTVRMSEPRRFFRLTPKGYDFYQLTKQMETRLSMKENGEDL